MKKSEELMLLLEYNKMKGTSYHLRKQLSFEIGHPNTLLFDPSLEEIFMLEYSKSKTEYYLLKNPLMYHKSWPKEIHSIGQFYVQTKESNRVVTIDEIIENPAYKGMGLKRIMQDIFAKYIIEYDQAFLSMLKRLKKLYYLLPKNQDYILKNFRKKLLFSILFFLVILSIYIIPSQSYFIDFIGYQTIMNIFDNSSLLPRITNLIGRLSLLVLLFFFLIHFSFKSLLKDVKKGENIQRDFNEDLILNEHQKHIDKTILNIQLFISKIEDENKEKYQLLDTIYFEDNNLKIYQKNLYKIYQKNDVLQKNKNYYIKALKVTYYSALFLSILFICSLIIQTVIGVMFSV
jgi:hypothetical protein